MSKQKKRSRLFWILLAVYALVLLTAVAIGLWYFWNYIEAFEASRPEGVIKAYMQTATPEALSQKDAQTLTLVDSHIQTPEQSRRVMADSLDKPLVYAKNTKLSNDSRLVYMILCGSRTVGSVTMTVERTDDYGFDYWRIREESYDFSHLVGTPVSITVPEEFLVYADGVLLEEDYITESGIHYASVEQYYDRYDLPTLCTYTTAPVLGQPTLTVTDAQGNPVTIDESTDLEQFLVTSTQEEQAAVTELLEDFIPAYVDFISVTGGQGAMQSNLSRLTGHMVPGGDLAKRMADTVVALIWVTDRHASVKDITLAQCLRVEEGKFVCDVTYTVDTRDHTGRVEVTNRIDLTLVTTDRGLKVESMISH